LNRRGIGNRTVRGTREVVLQVVLVTGGWIGSVRILRALNFSKDGTRRTEARGENPDVRARQIQYHNEAAYRAFEFFLKISLAILAGIAAAALTIGEKPAVADTFKTLALAGACLLLLAATVFSVVIFAHQKSKIERWPRPYTWYQSLLWVEYWFIQGMLLVSVVMLRWFVPYLTAGK
jgi:hypothetical protein